MTSNLNIFTYLTNGTSILMSLFNNNENSLILDPLSTIIRLGILRFKKKGTKISILDNKITYQEPCIFQGTVRWKNGDKRTDLHNLMNPIKLACLWYNINDEKIKYIFDYSKIGLKKLKLSYKNSSKTTCHCIDHYINIINKAGENVSTTKISNETDNVIFKKFKDIWSEDEIKIIYLLLLELISIKEKKDDIYIVKKNEYLKAIESIINSKDFIIKKIVKDTLAGTINT